MDLPAQQSGVRVRSVEVWLGAGVGPSFVLRPFCTCVPPHMVLLLRAFMLGGECNNSCLVRRRRILSNTIKLELLMTNDKIVVTLASIAGFLLVSAVSILGWIAIKVWDMNPTVTETARRVDRIVEVLPDVKARLAFEDLERKFGVALLTTEPVQVSNGKWKSDVHYLDLLRGVQRTYSMQVKGPDDHIAAITVSGLTERTAREKLSLQDFVAASLVTEKPTALPSFLDGSSSYAILRSSTNYELRLRELLGSPVRQSSIEKGALKWEDLSAKLQAQEAALSPR